MNFQADILEVQHELNVLGHYRVNEDGLAGPRTWFAIAHELGLGIEEITSRQIPDVIAAAQRYMAKRSLYKGAADSIAGRLTWEAVRRALDVPHARPATEDAAPMPPPPVDITLAGNVDERTRHAIATLHAHTQPVAELLIVKGNAAVATFGLHWVITSGTRTYAEQAELFAQGRSRRGKIVTNARPGYSNHNFGIAFDVTLFNGSTPVWESPHYRRTLAPIGKRLGLTWGGDWTSINDEPHYEDKPKWAQGMSEGEMLRELRRRVANGRDIFTA